MDIHHSLALCLVELVHLCLAYGTLPIGQGILIIQRYIISEIADGCLEIAKHTVGDGTTHENQLLLLDILCHTQLCRELIYQREYLHGTILIQLLLRAYDIHLIRSLALSGSSLGT